MPALESTVLTVFLERMAESGRVDSAVIQGLSEQLSGAKLPKPEDLAALYAASAEGTEA